MTATVFQSLRLNGAAPVSYAYDPNGNMSSDGRRGVTIGYNIYESSRRNHCRKSKD
ncbi:MAG: hypothetical protein ACLR8Y_15835 [Alistipes indistinctus]